MDHMVEAVYTPYTTTLASDAMRDSVHPVLLVEGVFTGDAALQAEQMGSGAEQRAVTLVGTDEGEHRVRFTPPGAWKDVSLSLLAEEGKIPLQWERDGSCCVFTVTGTDFTIEASQRGSPFPFAGAVLAVGAFSALAFCLVMIQKKRSKPPRQVPPAHDKAAAPDSSAYAGKPS